MTRAIPTTVEFLVATTLAVLGVMPISTITADAQPSIEIAGSNSGVPEPLPEPPSDVLTPDRRGQSPSMKLGIRAGVNRSNYTNDRYLNNVPLDVGNVSGETDVYSSAAGFGYNAGLVFENPYNTGLSLFATLEFVHVTFGSVGAVDQPCIDGDGSERMGTSQHEYAAHINYIRGSFGGRLNFPMFGRPAYGLLGLAGEHPVHTSLRRTRTFVGSGCNFIETMEETIDEQGEIPDPNGLHYALRMAVGLIYRLSDGIEFSPELTLDFGMSAINKSPESDLGVYSLNAVLRFDL